MKHRYGYRPVQKYRRIHSEGFVLKVTVVDSPSIDIISGVVSELELNFKW